MTDTSTLENTDFDFLAGEWTVVNRRLRKALADSTEWYEFPATLSFRHMIGGIANVDELLAPEQGMNGLTLRTFDIERQEWSIFWVNQKNGRMDVPVVGRFVDGVGAFIGPDVFEGTPITVRYLWDTTGPAPHWEQAFSTDGGETWETNWTSDFTRR
jgi:hypothetical protein